MMADQNSRINIASGPGFERTAYDPTAPSAIEVEHIVKKYGDFEAVKGVHVGSHEVELMSMDPI